MSAVFLTRRHGYKVLLRNYATEQGEIDLICRCGSVLVFVEVRARHSEQFGTPIESIDGEKQGKIERVAHSYIRQLKVEHLVFRIDAVGVVMKAGELPRFKLVKDLQRNSGS